MQIRPQKDEKAMILEKEGKGRILSRLAKDSINFMGQINSLEEIL